MTADAKQKILIRLPGTLQMMVRALPLLVQIREGFPLARITVLVQQKFKAVLRNISDIEVIAFVKKPRFAPVLESGVDAISFIQMGEYDLGIILPYSFSSAYLFYQGMVKRRIGFVRPFGSFMLTDRAVGDSFADLLTPLGISSKGWVPELYAKRQKQSQLHIGIAVQSNAEIATQRWYLSLKAFIKEEISHVKISLLPCRKGVDDFSLEEKIDLIHNLDVFASNDIGLLEVSAAVDTPAVDLSGFVDKEHFLPEDFFYKIKEAMLHPLKDRSLMHSYSEYLPITKGHATKNVTVKAPKKVGVVILAGGMGRRLGHSSPKGLLPIGGQCLFDILLDKAKGAERVGILTSSVTYMDTKKYLGPRDVDLFEKKVYPTEEGDGVSPEGNGALFDALVYSDFWDNWKDLDIISVIAVDNPLADPLDESLISTDKELSIIGVKREKGDAKLGVLCKKGTNIAVREYFTLGKDGLEGLGYSGSFAATPAFFEKVAHKKLPFYRVTKKDKIFYERLLIDGFVFAKDFDIIEKKREECFFPIKEKRDLSAYCMRLEH
jgi:ADP-heptose:LPS heptosyltransferase